MANTQTTAECNCKKLTPLTDEQINQIEKHGEFWIDGTPLQFARAIEAAHGIKGDA